MKSSGIHVHFVGVGSILNGQSESSLPNDNYMHEVIGFRDLSASAVAKQVAYRTCKGKEIRFSYIKIYMRTKPKPLHKSGNFYATNALILLTTKVYGLMTSEKF